MMGGLMGTMMTGAALGTGSAIAHRAVDGAIGMFSGSGSEGQAAAAPAPAQQAAGGVCDNQSKAFAECMSNTNGDMGACEFFFNTLQQCKAANGV
eukprot:TRINITY_DN3899_c0_g1_i4.p4 TRINITY_DN3899_c0_g1~~TRINITY_DN3899_c0_g1_i4.p4  ORF type:complete len:109 (-),score=36.23 TRINITY_DN3899_c0_g1_i4:238-522(-)